MRLVYSEGKKARPAVSLRMCTRGCAFLPDGHAPRLSETSGRRSAAREYLRRGGVLLHDKHNERSKS
jgi:hypothetical protein